MPPPFHRVIQKGFRIQRNPENLHWTYILTPWKNHKRQPQAVQDGYNKGFRVQRNPRIYTDPPILSLSKNCSRQPQAVIRRHGTKKIKTCQAFFLFFSWQTLFFFVNFKSLTIQCRHYKKRNGSLFVWECPWNCYCLC